MKHLLRAVIGYLLLAAGTSGWAASGIVAPLVPLAAEGITIPSGAQIRLYSAPMSSGAVFHDSQQTYILSSGDPEMQKAVITDSAGNAMTYTDSEVLGGSSWRGGVIYNGQLQVVSDNNPNAPYGGLFAVDKDGTFQQWPLDYNHAGSNAILSGVKSSLFLPAPLPESLILPEGWSSRVLRTNYSLGAINSLFFDTNGDLYVFNSSPNRRSLARIDQDGLWRRVVESEVLEGTNYRAGAVHGDGFVVAVDYAPDTTGNGLKGIYLLNGDGTYSQWTLEREHAGISDLIPAPGGGYYFTDFENDNIWHITEPGQPETAVLEDPPVALLSLAVSDSGEICALNWIPGEWWSNGGVNAIYRIQGNTAVLAAQAPEGSRLRGIAAAKGGLFGDAFYVTDAVGGRVLRLESDNSLTPVISGLPDPSLIRFDPVTQSMVVSCDGQYLFWFGENLTPFSEPEAPPDSPEGLFFSDFEKDNIWFVPDWGSGEIAVIDSAVPAGLRTMAYNHLDNVIYALNKGGDWPFGGDDALYAISPGGTADQMLKGSFNAIAMSQGGIFGQALYVSQADSGKIMKVETDGALSDVITGLPTPSALSFDPVAGTLTVLCDGGRQIAWIGTDLMAPAAGDPGTVGNYFAPAEQPFVQIGTATIVGSQVELALPDSETAWYQVTSKKALSGDFDIITEIEMAPETLQSGQNRTALVCVKSDVAGQTSRQLAYAGIRQTTVGWDSTAGKYYACTDMKIGGAYGSYSSRQMTDNSVSGTFRIQRTGAVITTYYRIADQWVQLNPSGKGFDDRVRIVFEINTGGGATLPVAHGAVFRQILPNSVPEIGGTPATTVSEGAAYSFVPQVSDPDLDPLIFSITNKPSWAFFDPGTGALTGTPTRTDIGTTTGVIISVSDGKTTVVLPGFDLSVLGASGLFGRVLIDVAGHTDLPVKNGTASLVGTGLSVPLEPLGGFAFTGLGSGSYTVEIAVPGLKPVKRMVDVAVQQNLDLGSAKPTVGAYTQGDLDQAEQEARAICDLNGDGRSGLEEAILLLRTISGR